MSRPRRALQLRGFEFGSGAAANPLAVMCENLRAMNFAMHWSLDPSVAYLNHGSFGACPFAVLAFQAALRLEMEREPVDFMSAALPARLNAAREALAAFLGADPLDLVFVPNATTGVNAVLHSLSFGPDDELLVTSHTYAACRKAIEFVAARSRARVTVAKLPFPCRDAEEILAAVLECVTPRTRLALIDHVTSPTALILPLKRLVGELQARGVDTLVDGAHAPGMVPLALTELGAAYYTGNAHKWLCAPKGAAFLHARRDRRSDTVVMHSRVAAFRGQVVARRLAGRDRRQSCTRPAGPRALAALLAGRNSLPRIDDWLHGGDTAAARARGLTGRPPRHERSARLVPRARHRGLVPSESRAAAANLRAAL